MIFPALLLGLCDLYIQLLEVCVVDSLLGCQLDIQGVRHWTQVLTRNHIPQNDLYNRFV